MVNEQQKCWICGAQVPGRRKKRYCSDPCSKILSREEQRVDWWLNDSRKKGLLATLTLKQWLATLQHFGWLCAYCQKPLGKEEQFVYMDHFIPSSKKGGTTYDNCVPCCWKCSKDKADSIPDEVIVIPREAMQRVKAYLDTLIAQ